MKARLFILISFTFLCFSSNTFAGYSPCPYRNFIDTDYIAVHFFYADPSVDLLKTENYFYDLLETDFKKRSEKLKRNFTLVADSSIVSENYSLTVTFANLKVDEEKKEQTSRLASRTISRTTHDKELMEHKVGSEDKRTEIIRIKKIIPCTMTIDIELKNKKADIVFTKSFFGSYQWVNEFISFNGSEELLSREEQKLLKAGEQSPPTIAVLVKKLQEQTYKDVAEGFNPVFAGKKAF